MIWSFKTILKNIYNIKCKKMPNFFIVANGKTCTFSLVIYKKELCILEFIIKYKHLVCKI